MTRTTSAKAYREETENGNITKKQRQVLSFLQDKGPHTANEISAVIPGAWKRLSELHRMGLVSTMHGTLEDRKTKKQCTIWNAVDSSNILLAIPVISKPTRKALEEKISHLEARCIELETIIAGYPTLMGLIYDKGYQEGVKDGTTGNIVGLEGIYEGD